MDFRVEIDPSAPVTPGRETFVLEQAGQRRTVNLHDYDAIFAVAGLYEHVVQDRLACRSPQTLAAALAGAALRAGASTGGVRCLDVGAGNGVVGEALRTTGLTPVVALDVSGEAARATARDRPGLYADYVVAALGAAPVPELITRHRLTALVSAGALTGGHIEPRVLAETWAAFAPGDWLAFTCVEQHADAARALVADTTAFAVDERFVHRRQTDGGPVWYRVLVGRRRAAA